MPKKKAPKKPVKRKAEPKPKHDIEKGFEDFGKEMESIGNRLEKRFDSDDCCNSRGLGTFGPILASIVGILFIFVGAWFFGIINNSLGIEFLNPVVDYFRTNLALFFMVFLFMGYTSYLSKNYHKVYRPIYPLGTAAGIIITLWILCDIVSIVNVSLNIGFIDTVIGFCRGNIQFLFLLFAIIGYIALAAGKMGCPVCEETHDTVKPKTKAKKMKSGKPDIKRLYRSGDDKILGGVCGGIADYLGVDPVLIRLLWVVFSLIWGTGILAYIIAWIIIPRNPKQEWDD